MCSRRDSLSFKKGDNEPMSECAEGSGFVCQIAAGRLCTSTPRLRLPRGQEWKPKA